MVRHFRSTVEKEPMKNRSKAREAGFSLIEALIAAFLVLMITLGVMPLFTHSVVQNVSGKESTISTNYSRSTTEELVSLPLDRRQVRPSTGLIERKTCYSYEESGGWKEVTACNPTNDPYDNPTWGRTTSIRQYSINEIYDGDSAAGNPTFKNPILGYDVSNDRLDSFVHVRELMVITEGQRAEGSPLGKGRRVDMVELRGF